jgi:hypothetical protein
MRIVSWNVNGLRAAMQKGFEGWMAEEQADVICLQETKLQAEQIPPSLNPPPEGESHWSHAEKKGYSGVAMLVKGARPRSVQVGFGPRRYDEEGRVLVADYGRFLLVNGYFPSGSSGMERVDFKLEFYRDLTDWLLERCEPCTNVVTDGWHGYSKKRLARGGMGDVFLARHPALGTEVAVKFLSPELARDPALHERFLQEARITATFSIRSRALALSKCGTSTFHNCSRVREPLRAW